MYLAVAGGWTLVAAILSVSSFALDASVPILTVAAGMLPLAQDAIRYGSLASGRLWAVFAADSSWLLGSAGAITILAPADLLSAARIWALASVPLAIVLAMFAFGGSLQMHVLSGVLRLGRFGVGDALAAAAVGLLPLWIVSAIDPDSSVAAFRIAQTLFGPLNIVAGALVLNLVLIAKTIQNESPDDLSGRRKLAQRRLRYLLAAYCVPVSTIASFLVLTYPEPVAGQLKYAVPVTAISAVLATAATPVIAILRSRGQQKLAFKVRIQIACAAAVSLVVSLGVYLATGFDPIVIPVLVSGVAAILLWPQAFRRFLGTERLA